MSKQKVKIVEMKQFKPSKTNTILFRATFASLLTLTWQTFTEKLSDSQTKMYKT